VRSRVAKERGCEAVAGCHGAGAWQVGQFTVIMATNETVIKRRIIAFQAALPGGHK